MNGSRQQAFLFRQWKSNIWKIGVIERIGELLQVGNGEDYCPLRGLWRDAEATAEPVAGYL